MFKTRKVPYLKYSCQRRHQKPILRLISIKCTFKVKALNAHVVLNLGRMENDIQVNVHNVSPEICGTSNQILVTVNMNVRGFKNIIRVNGRGGGENVDLNTLDRICDDNNTNCLNITETMENECYKTNDTIGELDSIDCTKFARRE